VTLSLFAADVIVTNDGDPIADGAVLVEDGVVRDVGPRDELAARHPRANERRWAGVMTPGLVNAHAHLQYTEYADLATTGLPFDQWIAALQRRRSTWTTEQWAEGTRRGIHQLLRSGTTAVADVVSDDGPLLPTARAGVAGISYIEVVGADKRVWDEGRRAETLRRLDAAPPGRTVGVSPHAIYTLSSAVIEEIAVIARERGLRMHPHLAESHDETEYVRDGQGRFADLNVQYGIEMELMGCGAGCSPTAYLDSLAVLGGDVHVAHGVQCDADDRALLRRRDVVVALCVRSNRILGAGDPPVAAYLDEGNVVAIGTDSSASTPSLDLWEEARALRDAARAQGYDASDLDRRIVDAATVGGATAMGLAESVGVIRPGVRADLAVFDVPTSGTGVHTALVDHGAGACVATVLAGRLVHRR
jgi:cytosine/adenosine deaminase-related metal-dependent hydrolase